MRNVIFKLDCKQVVDEKTLIPKKVVDNIRVKFFQKKKSRKLKSIRSKYDSIIDDYRVILSRHNMLCLIDKESMVALMIFQWCLLLIMLPWLMVVLYKLFGLSWKINMLPKE
jgi:hypothetical protein